MEELYREYNNIITTITSTISSLSNTTSLNNKKILINKKISQPKHAHHQHQHKSLQYIQDIIYQLLDSITILSCFLHAIPTDYIKKWNDLWNKYNLYIYIYIIILYM